MQDPRTNSPDGATASTEQVHLLAISRTPDARKIRTINRVRWIEQGSLAGAATSPSPGPLGHTAFLEALHRSLAILPTQFGTGFSNEQAVRAFLDRRREEFLRCLDRLEGTCEMGLRIDLRNRQTPTHLSVSRDQGHPSFSPAQYLVQRKASYEWRDRLEDQSNRTAQHYVQVLQGLYRDWRRLSASAPGIVRLSFLVEQTHAHAFRDGLTTMTTKVEGDGCVVMGPWPPYSFVSP